MTLGDILKEAAKRDFAGNKLLTREGNVRSPLTYTEEVRAGKFEIKLASAEDNEAYVECSVPDDGQESLKIIVVFTSFPWFIMLPFMV